MRLIDADALYFAQRYARVDPDSDRLTPVLAVDKHQIEHTPTIDAVPVAQLREMLSNLESKCFGDGEETYTSGYRNGHRNGQIGLLRSILQVPDGTSEDTRKDGDG